MISAAPSRGGPYQIPPLPVLIATVVVAVFLWTVGIVLFFGLPSYYRQSADRVPSLYMSLLRRKTVIWFFIAVVLQNYFLAVPYGRNWFFLFSSKHVSYGAILGLTAFFFVIVWTAILLGFAWISKSHPWFLPLFAVGLGAPRWAQMLWGTSGFGLYLPWAGSATLGAILSRSLWLWLGVLDNIQNAGIGMLLMVTLTRVHIFVAMIIAQVIGSITTIVARASAPNNVGPGDVFPDFSEGLGTVFSKPWFWVGLGTQIIVCVGFFKFFRKEQISKP
jgi:alpha-1,3-glucan synthase